MDDIRKYVLLVEDDFETAEKFSRILRESQYRVEIAYGSTVAIHKMKTETPDVVLLDIMMPDISGLEVLRFMRRDPVLAQVPVIIISAKTQAEDIELGLETGAMAYFPKPVSLDDLRAAVAEALGGPKEAAE